jgi:hypothetical protein
VNPIKPTYVDRPEVTEVFFDHVRMCMFNENALRMEFCVTRFDEPKPPAAPASKHVTAIRLATTPTGLAQLYDQLTNLVAALEKQGVLHRNVPPAVSSVPTPPKH